MAQQYITILRSHWTDKKGIRATPQRYKVVSLLRRQAANAHHHCTEETATAKDSLPVAKLLIQHGREVGQILF